MNLRLRKARKGVEPIVAAILLIAIAIVAGVLLYLWISRLTTSSTAGGTTIASELQVLSVTGSGTSLTIYVKSPVHLTSYSSINVYVYKANGQYVTAGKCSVTGNTYDVYTVSCTLGSSLSSGTYYATLDISGLGTVTTPSFTVP